MVTLSQLDVMYVYDDLAADRAAFRLLEVCAGHINDPIQATIRQAHFDEVPRPLYETVSYHWENADAVETITLNGAAARIPTNAAAAIRQVRLITSTRVVWIDAVCINQQDIDERAQQVRLMKKVYSRSRGNLIFLGSADHDVDLALLSVETIIREVGADTNGFRDFSDVFLDAGFHHRKSSRASDLLKSVDLRALRAFFSKPWFRRVWIVQEAVLAPRNTVICGAHQVPLSRLLIATAWLSYQEPWLPIEYQDFPGICYPPFMISHLRHMEELPPQSQKPPCQDDLANLLAFQHRLESTDLRDRVFGLLGLMSYQSIPESLIPDYSKDPIAVLRDATRLAMSESVVGKPTGLNIVLRRILHDSQTDLADTPWPSWVPRWTRHLTNIHHGRRLHIKFDASRGRKGPGENLLKADNSKLLNLDGIRIGTIVQVGSVLTRVVCNGPLGLHDWLEEAQLMATGKQLMQPRSQADLALTLATGMNAERNITDGEALLSSFQEFSRCTSQSKPLSNKAQSFYQALLNGSICRQLFLTSSGGLGIGPSCILPGDIVSILFGTNTPYVLRPFEGNYQILGQCYMQGIMFGEAVEAHSWQCSCDETFVIC